MKTYNIMEISKMPNMEVEVTYGNGEKRNTNIIVDKNGNIPDCYTEGIVYACSEMLQATYTLVQKPISFMEAVESGKNIKLDICGLEYVIFYQQDVEFLNEYREVESLLEYLGQNFSEREIRIILLEGRFYIKD